MAATDRPFAYARDDVLARDPCAALAAALDGRGEHLALVQAEIDGRAAGTITRRHPWRPGTPQAVAEERAGATRDGGPAPDGASRPPGGVRRVRAGLVTPGMTIRRPRPAHDPGDCPFLHEMCAWRTVGRVVVEYRGRRAFYGSDGARLTAASYAANTVFEVREVREVRDGGGA